MKTLGLFESISNGYFLAGNKSFEYLKSKMILIKLLFFPIAFFVFVCMGLSGIFFRMFILLDWISDFIDGLRKGVLSMLTNLQNDIPNSFRAFIFNPLLITLLAPVFFLCALLPKFSSNINSFIGDTMVQFSEGVFKKMNRICWTSASNLFRYVANAPLLLKPVLSIVAIVLSLMLILVGIAFFIFIIFDLFSALLERLRNTLVNIVYRLANSSSNSFTGFIFSPALMVVMIPVLVFLLIVPKISSVMDNA